jgi:hypothetical protein
MSDQDETKGDEKTETVDDDKTYVAVRYHGETVVGELLSEDQEGAMLTKMIRILEVPLPERSALGQIKVTTETAILPIIPTTGIATGNKIWVPFAGAHWKTVLSAEQYQDLVKSITLVDDGKVPSVDDLMNIGRGRRRQ